MGADFDAIVAGHVCLDVIPQSIPSTRPPGSALEPGALHEIGPVVLAAGGAVANTRLALDRLGLAVRLVGKVGDDPFGAVVRRLLTDRAQTAFDDMLVDPSSCTSYSIVFSQPGIDRTFWHCPGANDTFQASDIATPWLDHVRLFHFGYPPLMRLMYSRGAGELATMLRHVRDRGCTTSLDMALPDPSSEASGADWAAILEEALPHTDIFAPSLEEILVMLGPSIAAVQPVVGGPPDPRVLRAIGDRILEMGARVVLIKLGGAGAYVRTAGSSLVANMGRATPSQPASWADRELWAPCLDVDVVGTTGAGDVTVAGFLAGLLRGQDPEAALASAVAVGACSVEAADAFSGIRSWEATQARLASGWRSSPLALPPKWERCRRLAVWRGPIDSGWEGPRGA